MNYIYYLIPQFYTGKANTSMGLLEKLAATVHHLYVDKNNPNSNEHL